MKWKDAIVKVLGDENRALHYTEIAEIIAEKKYVKSLGATPQISVSSYITTDINSNKDSSTFVKVDRGMYMLRKSLEAKSTSNVDEKAEKDIEQQRFINSFGIYWNRQLVHWKTMPDLFGIQQIGAKDVNFKEQIGIYLLHDGRETIYVGQAIDQPLAVRLKNHTSDRLGGRWDRFSWFGFHPVGEDGKLNDSTVYDKLSVKDLGNLLEAILIESIEPRQNRKQGNLFSGIEYLQKESPEIEKRRKEELLKKLSENL